MDAKKYEYHRIGELAEQLEAAGIETEIIAKMMEGGDNILRKTKSEDKAEWLRGAMLRMNKIIDFPT